MQVRSKKSPIFKRKKAKEPDFVPEAELDTDPDKLFETPKIGIDVGGKDVMKHDMDLLMFERAVKHPDLHPHRFLLEKGYSPGQASGLLGRAPAAEWDRVKDHVLNKITEGIVKRHVDLIAEVQDQHVKGSKLVFAKALEMMSKMPIDEEWVEDSTARGGRRLKRRVMRSIDLLNCANSVKIAQDIYRKALGLPNDSGGLQQILEVLEQQKQGINVQQNNLTVNIGNAGVPPEVVERLQKMDYDQVLVLIEEKRKQQKLIEEKK